MYKKILLLPYLFLILNSSFCQFKFVNPIRLSNQSQISLLTVDRADEELFQAFGHIIIYISDPANQIDRAYSYGSFDFKTDNFYWKFITGQLPYQISVTNLEYTLLEYSQQFENRSVLKQELKLSLDQKQRVFEILEKNLLPQNKTYQYKFFQDNCSTRIRDVFKKAMGDSLKFSKKGIEQGLGYRDWMNKNLPNTPWARFGMNLAIGTPSDKPNTNEETFYLPDNMRIAANNATNGGRPLVSSSNILFQSYRPNSGEKTQFTPIIAFSLLLIFGILYSFYQFKNNNTSFWFDKMLFISSGILGLLIVFLWFFTSHGVTKYNWNLLWAWPINILIPFLLKNKKIKPLLTIYQGFILIAILIGFSLNFFNKEIYPWAILPFLLLLLARISLLKVNLITKNMNQN